MQAMRLLLVVVLAACGKSKPNCEPAVKHVMWLTEGPPARSPRAVKCRA